MKYISAIFFLMLVTMAQSQDYNISGSITDQNQEVLPSATVVVLAEIDSTMAGFALSTNDGRFIVRDLAAGKYLLQISYLGYEQYNQKVSLIDEDIKLPTIQLITASNQMNEIVVKGENIPISVNQDTIIYNADAFKTNPNDVVEDLLRQMPGVEVEEDGTIIAQGEEVKKVTVDGKEFFGSDPKIATKNLPAKAINKVQIFDKKSERAEFSGIDDGEREKTMNLELKEEYKKGYFGNVEAGAGYDENTESTRYKTRGTINRFSKKSQVSLIGNLNNVNEQGFSSADYFSFMSSSGGFGRGRQGNSGISINQGLSDGFVNTAASGINFNYNFSDDTDLNLSYFINDINNSLQSITDRETFIDNEQSFFTNDLLNQVSENLSHNLNVRLEHEIDSSQNIRLTSSLAISDGRMTNIELTDVISENGTVENTGNRTYSSDATQVKPSGSLLYKKKFGKEKVRVYTIEGAINQSHSDMDGMLTSTTTISPNDPTNQIVRQLLQEQIQKDDENAYSIDATFTEPLGGRQYLDFNYRYSNTANDAATDVFDIEGSNQTLNDFLSTMYTRDFSYQRAGISWQYDGDKTNLTIGAKLQKSDLQGELITVNQTIKNSNYALLPELQYRYEIDRGHNFRLQYNSNVNQPTIEQLQPVVNQSDPLNLYIGNPDLNVEKRHNIRANYIKWDQFNFSSLFAFVTLTYTRDKIINQTFIDENFIQKTSPVNVSDDINIRTNISYSRPIRSLGIKAKINLSNTYQNSIQFINLKKNDLNRYNTALGFTLENRNKEKYSISTSARWTYNTSLYSQNSNQNLSYLNHNYNIGARLDAIKSWSFATDLDLKYFSEQNFSPAQTLPIWKASISRYFLPGDKGEFRISAYDLLNKNQGINRTANANYVENEVANSLGRYVMASFLYNFNSAGADAKGSREKTMMMMH